MGWLRDGEMPLNELPVRVNRIAYREYTKNPGLGDATTADDSFARRFVRAPLDGQEALVDSLRTGRAAEIRIEAIGKPVTQSLALSGSDAAIGGARACRARRNANRRA